MSLEEANYHIRMSIDYSPNGWYWHIETNRPFGFILGYKKYADPNDAVEELKQFLRYFTPKVLESGDSIRKYVEKHKLKENE